MTTRTPRGQRGITLIEIVLWCAIVAAATVAVFVFSKKASVTAAVETEQRQIEDIVKTVDGLFATQSDFSALGTNGAVYLRERAERSGLKFGTNAAGDPALMTGLGGGSGTLTLSVQSVTLPAGPSLPNNAYRLAYNGLTANECVRLVTASYPVAQRVRVSHDLDDATGVPMAARGQLTVTPDQIAQNCSASATPSVFLYFVPPRAIAAAPVATPPPAARCNPVHESQNVACPAGQIGTITQERDGTCTGPGNSLVYTVWTTTGDTCQDPPSPPPTVTPPTSPDDCAINTYTQVLACPVGQIGQVVQSRNHDTCAGTYTAWATISNSCAPQPPTGTCSPETQNQTVACPAGQGGQLVQSRSSTCPTPTSAPVWGSWSTVSNTCTTSCTQGGNSCCTVQRQTQPGPACPAGTYGAAGEQERFLGCVNAQTQSGSWTPWQDMTSGTCTACPATSTETQTQWDPRTDACPAGMTGSITYEAEQVRTRDVSYNCPAGTPVLPSPTTTAWGSWADTGTRRNTVNTCASTSGCSTDTNWQNHLLDANDQSLDPAGTTYSCGNPTTWHNTCSAGDTCHAESRPGSGGSGWNSWDEWDMVCTGACTASSCELKLISSVAGNESSCSGPDRYYERWTWTDSSGSKYGSCVNRSPVGAGTLCTGDVSALSTSTGHTTGVTFGERAAGTIVDASLLNGSTLTYEYCEGAGSPSVEGQAQYGVYGCYDPSTQCDIPAGHVFNWTVGANSCTFTQPTATTVATNSNFPVNDATAPATGAASFNCDAAGNLSATANTGATCSAPVSTCYTPTPTNPALLTGRWRVGLRGPSNGGPAGGWLWNDGVGFRGAIQHDAARVTQYMTAIGLGGSATFNKCIPSIFGDLTVFNGVEANRGGAQADAARTTWGSWNNVTFLDYIGNSTNVNYTGWTEIWLPRLATPALTCVPGEMIVTRSNNGFGSSTHIYLECEAAPIQCSVPAGHVFNWVVGGNSCTFTQGSATTVSAGTNFGVTDSTAPATGNASFNCSAGGVLSATPQAGATCTMPPVFNGLCSQITRPLTWGCGEIRYSGGVWNHVAGSVQIDEALNGGWMGNGTIGTKCVFGYADALDAQGYPSPLSSADRGKLIFDHMAPSAEDFEWEFKNGSDGSWVGYVGWTRIYARNSAPNPVRGEQCRWTKWDLMNN